MQRSNLLLKFPEWLRIILTLCKIKISLAVAVTSSVGFVLSGHDLASLFLPISGIFLLACGAAALNQYQERATDAVMERTRHRPIPNGKISPFSALRLAIIWMICGLAVLLYVDTRLFSLGVLVGFWYNGLYTYLKQKTAWAALPGGLIGAIPPVMGYVAGGGDILDVRIWTVALFFFVWQIPHFWLLVLMHHGDYQRARLPTLLETLSPQEMVRLIHGWILATVAVAICIFWVWETKSTIVWLALLISSLGMAWNCRKIASLNLLSLRRTFITLNAYALLVVVLLSIDRASS